MDMYLEEIAMEEIAREEECNEFDCSTINYHNITHDDMLNGEGLRVVLWVAGCTHKCKECQNPETWDSNGGIPFTEWDQAEFWEWLSKPWTQGATFSGGDPLHPDNREYIGKMAKTIKERYPDKDIWLYTGYSLEYDDGFYFEDSVINESFEYEYLKYIDVLVDGRFMCDVRATDIKAGKKVLWCGSSNQRIIDVRETLEKKDIVLK